MGFTTINMINADTLCNENNYGTEKQREEEIIQALLLINLSF